MSQRTSTKVHTHIGHERSLCGLAPKNGTYNIASFSSFFTALPEHQCGKCIVRLKERGYKIDKLRTQFRSIYDHAQELALVA